MAKSIEEWRDIEGHEGLYQVSNLGNVRSLDREVVHSRNANYTVTRKGKPISTVNHGNGYRYITLAKDGKRKNHYVHRLVASAFVPNERGLNEVDHIDENRANNKAENLRWVTHSENMLHSSTRDKPRKPWKISNTGERYISARAGRFRFCITRKGCRFEKSFATLSEAIQYRDSFFKEVV